MISLLVCLVARVVSTMFLLDTCGFPCHCQTEKCGRIVSFSWAAMFVYREQRKTQKQKSHVTARRVVVLSWLFCCYKKKY
jgi:hypothetical protein